MRNAARRLVELVQVEMNGMVLIATVISLMILSA